VPDVDDQGILRGSSLGRENVATSGLIKSVGGEPVDSFSGHRDEFAAA
jgi:hypothetical protein